MHMKRTNLVLDEKLLEEATRLSAQRTYSKTVNLALSEFVRRARAGKVLDLAGSGLWEGSLSEMRRDSKAKPRRRGSRVAA
jgi:Arc/MetJ family transcription regulator